jgi:hypothetical protein
MATFASVNLKATMRDLGVIALSMLTPTATEANLRSVDPSGGRIELDKSQLDMYVVTMADSTLSAPIVALTADTAHVVAVEPDWLRRTQLTPNDSLFANQWWLANTGTNAGYPGAVPGADLGAIGAWSLTIGSDRQIPVVVIDTGCNLSHPDFSPGPGHPSRVIAGPDFIQGGTVEGE